eukprot:TRINITY_DN19662_c0_g1_i1.p1 TRINITY_DN19662_c0_g1~~TRINITY_DN19662_c0_g1_i1.p1  ORF type:complete len:755 (+),score=287.58 TRINITY_DN19662_c0_g1_i1:142-2406(+)
MAERVSVNIRFRPLNNEEQYQHGQAQCVKLSPHSPNEIEATDGKRFTFDKIFATDATQDDVYEAVGVPVVKSVLHGYNGTVLAYGQTGSGKTFTMTGPDGGRPDVLAPSHPHFANRGLILRVLDSIFSGLAALPVEEVASSVTLTVVELYKETLKDLLAPPGGAKDLRIREDRASGRGVYIDGVVESPVATLEEAVALIMSGMEQKQIASTGSNETSSRSHTIVTVNVIQVNHVKGDARTVGRLNLVDLAGSERVDKTRAEGDRLEEAKLINLSLTLLGNVIMKLTDGHSVHIPYRDSKLTRILQDSFGGNSRTTLFCNCSVSPMHMSETLSTLMFANRAKHIQNKPRVNKELHGQDLQQAYLRAQEEIVQLKIRIANLEEQVGGHQMPMRKRKNSAGAGRPGTPATPVSGGTAAPSAHSHGVEKFEKQAAVLEEYKEEIKSMMKELEDVREEAAEREAEMSAQKERVGFWEKREKEAAGKAADWKAKYEREKMSADSWLRKYNELVKERDAAKHAPAEDAKAPAKKKPSAGALAKKGSVSKLGGRKGSVTRRPSGTPASSAPVAGDGEDDLAGELRRAKEGEAAALQTERDLRDKIEALSFDVEVEQNKRADMEKQLKHYMLLAQNFDLKLETIAQDNDAKVRHLEQELAAAQGSARPGENANAMINGQLEEENRLLYENHRETVQRLVEMTRDKDQAERESKQATQDRDKLMKQIELSNISTELKQKLLGDKIRATKMAFQARLLQCFSDDP